MSYRTPSRALCLLLLFPSIVAAGMLRPLPALAQADAAGLTLPPLKVVDPAYIDRAANACRDFDEFANGAWLKRDTIKAAYSSSGVARDMSDRNEEAVRAVLDDAMRQAPRLPLASTERKLGTFYRTCMDSTAAEREGVAPMRPALAEIARILTPARLTSAIARLHTGGTDVAFRYSPQADPHDAARYLASFYQGGLGLPDRDYYTNRGPAADSLRTAYVEHIARLLGLAGETRASARADAARVLALETELAKSSLTRVQLRDPAATDHPMSIGQLRGIAPEIDWPAYFRVIGVAHPVERVNVSSPTFFARLSELMVERPLADWRAYLRYHTLAEAAPWLSTPFVREDFDFKTHFTGARALLPRWKRCLRATDALIGEALGEAYVNRTFSPQARARARQVIDDIRSAFGERVRRLDWMSDSTRAHALFKLAQMHEKVGYPDRWRDYTSLEVTRGPFVLNVQRANAFEWGRTANRPGTSMDTTEWDMTVPTVNAYYDPTKNEMVFPAGALQPQTFDDAADDAANYGSLGASWAGHELTHGFDDEGRHYDAHGNLKDWWIPADSLRFTREAQKVVDQFDRYIQVDTFHVNGRLTLGENIADLGGLLTAYDALEGLLQRKGRPGPIDGFTPEQRFFLGYAQSWRIHTRPEAMRNRVTTDPHAPEVWRVNGPLSNMPAFAQAFGCKPGDPMVRPAEVVAHIW